MNAPIRIAGHPATTVDAWTQALTGRDLLLDATDCTRFPLALGGALVAARRIGRVNGLDPATLRALRIIGASSWLDLGEAAGPATMPFSCAVRADGALVVRLHPSAPTHPAMPGGAAQGWLEHLAPVAIIIDLSALSSVNSVVIAWALQIAHQCVGAPVQVQGANRQITAQFQQLRLDRILSVAG